MRLSKKGEYALRAAIALARNLGAPTQTARIASTERIPKKFLEQILLALKAAGLVTSKAGPKGGYELALAPDKVTVGAILSAVEEPLSRQANRRKGDKPAAERTQLEVLMDDIRHYIRRKLDGVTLHQVASVDAPPAEIEALMWYI